MHFDSEEQRQMFIQLVDNAQWPGSIIERVVELKGQLRTATVGIDHPDKVKLNDALLRMQTLEDELRRRNN